MAMTSRTNLVVTSPAISQVVAQVDLTMVTITVMVDNLEEAPVARPEMDLMVLPAATRTLLVTTVMVETAENSHPESPPNSGWCFIRTS